MRTCNALAKIIAKWDKDKIIVLHIKPRMSGDHCFHIPEPRFSAIAQIGSIDPALPGPSGSVQHVRQVPILWPESGVLSGDHHFHFPKPRFSAVVPHGPNDPAVPGPLGSVQHV